MAIKQLVPIDITLIGDGVSTTFTFALANMYQNGTSSSLPVGAFGVVPSSISIPDPPTPVTSSSIDANGNITITLTTAPGNNVQYTFEVDLLYTSGAGSWSVPNQATNVALCIGAAGSPVNVSASAPIPISATAAANASGNPIFVESVTGSTTAVTQATAANLNATVVQGNAGSSSQAWPVYMTVAGTAIDPRAITSIGSPVTVSQATAASLNATVVGTGTFAVQAAQSGTWSNTVTQATGTNLHAVIDSGSVTITGTPAISGTVTANQGTANTAANAWPTATIVSGAAIDPRQIRALTSADVVSLPTAQVTTLTPPTAAAIGTAVAADLLTGTQLASASVPVALPTATITTLTPPTAAAIGTAVAAPTAAAIASAIVANPPTTPLPTGQVTTLTPPTAAAIGSAVASALTNPLPVSIAATVNTSDAHAYAIGSTTSGQSGFLEFGAVTSTNPVYTTATSEPLSLSQIGALRSDTTSWGGTAVSAPTVFGVSPISSSGTTSTYATTGASSPSALAFDSSGNVWIAGNGGVIQMSPTGSILQTVTFTGNGRGVAVDSSNNVWVADNTANSIIEYSSAGALLNTYTTGIHEPRLIAFDGLGNLWVPNNGSTTLVKLSSVGAVLATATVGANPFAVAIDASNNAWVSAQGTNSVVKVSNSGTVLGTFALTTGADPFGVAVDANQNIWTANFGNGTVTVLSNAGVILQTITLPTGAKPIGIAIDSLGNAWVSGGTGGDNNIHVISPGGAVIASYPTGASPYDVGIDSSGNVWVTNETATSVTKLSGYSTSTGIATNASLFSGITPLTNTGGALNVNVSSASGSIPSATAVIGNSAANAAYAAGTSVDATVDLTGATYVNTTQNNDAAGQLVSVTRTPQFQDNFSTNGADTTLMTATAAGAGAISYTNGFAVFTTGASGTSSYNLTSVTTLETRSGFEWFCNISGKFASGPAAGSHGRMGLYKGAPLTPAEGFFFGYEGTVFGITYFSNSVGGGSYSANVSPSVTLANFNGDKLTGAAGSNFTSGGVPVAITLNGTLQQYRLRGLWPVGSVFFEVLSPDGVWVVAHTIRFENANTANPSGYFSLWSVQLEVANTTNTAALGMVAIDCSFGTTDNQTRMSTAITSATLARTERAVLYGTNAATNPALYSGTFGTTPGSTSGTLSANASLFSGTTALTNTGGALNVTDNVTQWNSVAVGTPVTFGNSPTATGGVATNFTTTGVSTPSAIAIDGSGNAWIGGGALIQMSPTGTILQTLTTSGGSLRGVAIDSSGNIWAASNTGNEVYGFTSAGVPLSGSPFTGSSTITAPRFIAFDNSGNLWVPSSTTGQVTKLSSTGAFIVSEGFGTGGIIGVAVDNQNNIWMCNNINGTVVKMSNTGTVLGTFTVGTSPYGCAFDQSGNLWVANSGSNSVTLLNQLGVTLGIFELPVGAEPRCPTIDAHGNCWVSNFGVNNNIYVLSPAGNLIATFVSGSGQVLGMAVDASGNTWLCNATTTAVTKMTGYTLSNAIGVNAALLSGNTQLTNTVGSLNVNVTGTNLSLPVTANLYVAGNQVGTGTPVPISGTAVANSFTNPIYVALTDGIDAMGSMHAFGVSPGGPLASLNVNASIFTGTAAVSASNPLFTRISDGAGNSVGMSSFNTYPGSFTTSLAVNASLWVSGAALSATTGGFLNVNDSTLDVSQNTVNITAADIVSTSTNWADSLIAITGTPTTNSAASFVINGDAECRIQMTGTLVGTVAIETSTDSGVTWFSFPLNIGGVRAATVTGASSPLTNFIGFGNVSAVTNVRVRCTTFTSGTGTVLFRSGNFTGSVQVANPQVIHDNTNSGNYAGIGPTWGTAYTTNGTMNVNASLAVGTTMVSASAPVPISATAAANTATNPIFHANTDGTAAMGTMANFGTSPTAVKSLNVNSSMFIGTTAARSNQTTTATGVVDVNIVGSLGVTNSATNGTFARITDNTTAITAAVSALGTAPTGTDVMAVNAVNLPTAAAGGALNAKVFSAQATAVNVKSSAGNLYGMAIQSATATAGFVMFFNTATTATTPTVWAFPIAASGSVIIPPSVLALFNFTTGIAINVATPLNGTTTQITWTGTIMYL